MYRIGVDLGGTNIVVGIVDNECRIVKRKTCKTNAGRSPEEIVNSVVELIYDVIEECGISFSDISSFGMGLPGLIDSTNGIVISAGNLGFYDVDIFSLLKKKTGKDFKIENDANTAAYGEFIAGEGKGTKNFVVMTLGTGIGSGIIIDGKIFTGTNFTGGEIGHITIDINGDKCRCGNIGCFENYASATALVNQTKRAMLKDKNTAMWSLVGSLDFVNGKTAFMAARNGDKTAIAVINEYIGYLSIGIINIIRMFGPQKICIGGGISNERERLIVPIVEYIKNHDVGGDMMKNTEICIAKMQNDAGVIGAAFLDEIK